MLQKFIEYKSAWNGYLTIYVPPKGASKICSRCGYRREDLRGQVFRCPNCGLVLDRQKNAARNIYHLGMWGLLGLPRKGPSPTSFPMNPEGSKGDEAQILHRAINPM